ncbi:MAG TPA: hypothetical protein VFW06_09470, partial [Acidimicrobiia bacterium]|nr:hypothetical protein [Acidimicrobiia bacterium]
MSGPAVASVSERSDTWAHTQVEEPQEAINVRLFDTAEKARPPVVGVTVIVRQGGKVVGKA